jgi:tetratricopeptide (TPR) repeat protein
MKPILIFLFFLLTNNLLANSNSDKLIEQLNYLSGKEKFDALISLINEGYIAGDSTMYKRYGSESIELAKQINDKNLEIDAINTLSWAESFYNQELSKSLAETAYDLSQNEKYSYGIASAGINLGFYYLSKDLLKSNKYLTEAFNIAKNDSIKPLLAISLFFLGELSAKYSNFSESLSYLLESMKVFSQFDYQSSNIELYQYGALMNMIGITYKRLTDYETASEYYEKYLAVSKQLDDKYDAAICYNNLGIICRYRRDYTKAFEYYKLSKSEFDKIGETWFIPDIMMNIGNLYSDLKNFDSAMFYFRLSENLYREKNNIGGIARINKIRGSIYNDNKKYYQAIQEFLNAIQLLKSTSELEILRDAYEGISVSYQKTGNYSLSLKYFMNYSKLKDSIAKNSNMEDIARITEKYKIENQLAEQKKNEELQAKAELQIQQRKFNMEYIIIVIFIIGVFITLFLVNRRWVRASIIDAMMFISLILLFEFLLLLKDALTWNWIGNDPLYNLIINVSLAVALSPVDNILEKILKKRKPEAV